jgi:hypothetical protein
MRRPTAASSGAHAWSSSPQASCVERQTGTPPAASGRALAPRPRTRRRSSPLHRVRRATSRLGQRLARRRSWAHNKMGNPTRRRWSARSKLDGVREPIASLQREPRQKASSDQCGVEEMEAVGPIATFHRQPRTIRRLLTMRRFGLCHLAGSAWRTYTVGRACSQNGAIPSSKYTRTLRTFQASRHHAGALIAEGNGSSRSIT